MDIFVESKKHLAALWGRRRGRALVVSMGVVFFLGRASEMVAAGERSTNFARCLQRRDFSLFRGSEQ